MSLTCELVVTVCVSVIAWHHRLKLILALTGRPLWSRSLSVLYTAPVKFEAFQSPTSHDSSAGGSVELISGGSQTLGRSQHASHSISFKRH